jgi:hypothetical protein
MKPLLRLLSAAACTYSQTTPERRRRSVFDPKHGASALDTIAAP